MEAGWEEEGSRGPGERLRLRPGPDTTLPELQRRGRCLISNWQEERATSELDGVPSPQNGSEGFYFRHGHPGLLTLQLPCPMSSSTTHRDSFQPPRQDCRPMRGQREAMLGLLFYHQFQKKAEDELYQAPEPPEYRSVTHRDYRQAGTLLGSPTPSQPHDYRLEEPETYWFQRAKDVRGVGAVQGLKPSFRRNSSFTTPVPLALSHHLP
ncbi:sperm-associated antigen 8 [Tachyglossus aculeatus]|uniref:sperm-associated antigen 8 n=1 Tax=Tachyglossus aculeatus TaxID=9261 RepID=UPI0018F40FFD|nr:sperm-associated antigen 8 [Tachyglossus aculeatus]